MTRSSTLILASTAALALSACGSKEPKELPPAPLPPTTTTGQTDYGTGTTGATGPGTQQHFVDAVAGQNIIYFDTDRYNIDSEDAAALQTQARYLGQYANVTVTVEGHADERGTRDYNLALGERRANAAKNYLVGLGIPATRVRTVSYGKERPAALGSNEAAWAQNRRAVTVVVN